MAELKECSVCCEEYGSIKNEKGKKTKHIKEIKCPYCEFSSCDECIKEFLFGSMDTMPFCMGCKKTWMYDFCVKKFTKTFMDKSWREHVTKIIKMKERRLLENTDLEDLMIVRKEKQKRERERAEKLKGTKDKEKEALKFEYQIKFLKIDIKYLRQEKKEIKEGESSEESSESDEKEKEKEKEKEEDIEKEEEEKKEKIKEIDEKIKKLNKKIAGLQTQKTELQIKITNEERNKYRLGDLNWDIKRLEKGEEPRMFVTQEVLRKHKNLEEEGDKEKEKEKEETQKFKFKCQDDNCRGYTGRGYKCQICEKITCSKCYKIKEGNHECNDDDVATVDEIKKNSKPCPNCGLRISKVNGCNQMWCIECGTAFSWTTGKIERGIIHNPHFFQYGDRRARNVRDVPCGGLPNRNQLNRLNPYINHYAFFHDVYTNAIHIQAIERREFKQENDLCLAIRLSYLTNKIDDKEFERQIFLENKKRDYEREIQDVLEIYILTITDISPLIFGENKDYDEAKKQIDAIIKYCNECLIKTAAKYNRQKIIIEPERVTHDNGHRKYAGSFRRNMVRAGNVYV